MSSFIERKIGSSKIINFFLCANRFDVSKLYEPLGSIFEPQVRKKFVASLVLIAYVEKPSRSIMTTLDLL